MTSKERILNSLKGLPTDRIPWCPFLAYYWESLPESIQEKGQLNYMKDIGADPLLRGMAELSQPVYSNCEITETIKGKTKHQEYHTPVGTLRLEYTYSSGGNTWFLTRHPVESREDFKILQYIFENMRLKEDILSFEKNNRLIGNDGLLIPIIGTQQKTSFQSLVEHWCGTVNLTYALADFPETVEECMMTMRERDKENVSIAAKSSAEGFIFWEDSSTTNISPQMFEEYTLPIIKEWGDIIHSSGKLLLHHACGHLRQLMPYIAVSGIDALESISPAPTGNIELKEARNALPDEIALIGGIEPVKFLNYSLDETYAYVRNILNDMKCSRYILANSDSCPPGVEEEKFRLISSIVRECQS